MVGIWALSVAAMDIAQRRIPNFLVGGAALVCLFVLAWIGQAPLGGGAWSVAGGLALALLLTLPGYLMRQLGAGDVKMLLAVATMGGYGLVLYTFISGALIAGVVALGCLLTRSYPWGASLPQTGRFLPFGAALACGLILAILFKSGLSLP
jgi:prepilin peptidase CpaA